MLFLISFVSEVYKLNVLIFLCLINFIIEIFVIMKKVMFN